jgi:chromate reductase
MALHAAAKLAPDNVELEVFHLEGIPLFNQDLEQNPPAKVKEFKAKIQEADAILIVTPEYNYSIPGVLKTPSTGPLGPTVTTPSTESLLP